MMQGANLRNRLSQAGRFNAGCRFVLLIALSVVILAFTPKATLGAAQSIVQAEALGSANVRILPNTTAEIIAKIEVGTRFRVLGRSSRVPWIFIDLVDGRGWVFNDLVKIYGDIGTIPYISEQTAGSKGTPPPAATEASIIVTATLTNTPATNSNPITETPTNVALPGSPVPMPTNTATQAQPKATATLNPAAVVAETQGELNVRYGPGTDFPRIGILLSGTRVQVLRRHTTFPWLEIGTDLIPGGRGWVFQDTLKILSGSVKTLPATNARDFGYPTLTPTRDQVVSAASPFIQSSAPTPNPNLKRLGVNIFEYLLNTRFEPNTNRQASAFLMDLSSGQAISLVPKVAFSGMSLIKIPILVETYRKLDFQPDNNTATQLAQMMICSNNDATNAMLAFSGDGDMLAGTRNVTNTMQTLGLKDTFITSPIRSDPRATPVPVGPFKTTADQTVTDPDPFNQATPADLGYLLSSVYYCAKDGTGALIAAFPNAITQDECKKMLRLLSSDKIGVMIEAGVPESVTVAHKHGWVDQTLGDAGIIYSPGGDFVLVVMMSERPVLLWTQEFPRVSEIARTVYNYYNPGARMAAINPKTIPENCTLPDDLLKELRGS
jgi:uncharacterized protein YraI